MMKKSNFWTILGQLIGGLFAFVMGIILLGMIWYWIITPGFRLAKGLFNFANPNRKVGIVQVVNPTAMPVVVNPTAMPVVINPTAMPVVVNPTAMPVVVNPTAMPVASGSKLTIVFNNGQERSFWMSAGDFDLEDRQEVWTLLKEVGASDVIVETSENLLFFFNGYYTGIVPGITHMGEIIPTSRSATAGYNSGFAIRYLANGCGKIIPEDQKPLLGDKDVLFFQEHCKK